MQNLKSLQQALNDLTPAGAAIELAVLCGALAVAYGLVWLVRGRTGSTGRASGSAAGCTTACSSRCWHCWSA